MSIRNKPTLNYQLTAVVEAYAVAIRRYHGLSGWSAMTNYSDSDAVLDTLVESFVTEANTLFDQIGDALRNSSAAIPDVLEDQYDKISDELQAMKSITRVSEYGNALVSLIQKIVVFLMESTVNYPDHGIDCSQEDIADNSIARLIAEMLPNHLTVTSDIAITAAGHRILDQIDGYIGYYDCEWLWGYDPTYMHLVLKEVAKCWTSKMPFEAKLAVRYLASTCFTQITELQVINNNPSPVELPSRSFYWVTWYHGDVSHGAGPEMAYESIRELINTYETVLADQLHEQAVRK